MAEPIYRPRLGNDPGLTAMQQGMSLIQNLDDRYDQRQRQRVSDAAAEQRMQANQMNMEAAQKKFREQERLEAATKATAHGNLMLANKMWGDAEARSSATGMVAAFSHGASTLVPATQITDGRSVLSAMQQATAQVEDPGLTNVTESLVASYSTPSPVYNDLAKKLGLDGMLSTAQVAGMMQRPGIEGKIAQEWFEGEATDSDFVNISAALSAPTFGSGQKLRVKLADPKDPRKRRSKYQFMGQFEIKAADVEAQEYANDVTMYGEGYAKKNMALRRQVAANQLASDLSASEINSQFHWLSEEGREKVLQDISLHGAYQRVETAFTTEGELDVIGARQAVHSLGKAGIFHSLVKDVRNTNEIEAAGQLNLELKQYLGSDDKKVHAQTMQLLVQRGTIKDTNSARDWMSALVSVPPTVAVQMPEVQRKLHTQGGAAAHLFDAQPESFVGASYLYALGGQEIFEKHEDTHAVVTFLEDRKNRDMVTRLAQTEYQTTERLTTGEGRNVVRTVRADSVVPPQALTRLLGLDVPGTKLTGDEIHRGLLTLEVGLRSGKGVLDITEMEPVYKEYYRNLEGPLTTEADLMKALGADGAADLNKVMGGFHSIAANLNPVVVESKTKVTRSEAGGRKSEKGMDLKVTSQPGSADGGIATGQGGQQQPTGTRFLDVTTGEQGTGVEKVDSATAKPTISYDSGAVLQLRDAYLQNPKQMEALHSLLRRVKTQDQFDALRSKMVGLGNDAADQVIKQVFDAVEADKKGVTNSIDQIELLARMEGLGDKALGNAPLQERIIGDKFVKSREFKQGGYTLLELRRGGEGSAPSYMLPEMLPGEELYSLREATAKLREQLDARQGEMMGYFASAKRAGYVDDTTLAQLRESVKGVRRETPLKDAQGNVLSGITDRKNQVQANVLLSAADLLGRGPQDFQKVKSKFPWAGKAFFTNEKAVARWVEKANHGRVDLKDVDKAGDVIQKTYNALVAEQTKIQGWLDRGEEDGVVEPTFSGLTPGSPYVTPVNRRRPIVQGSPREAQLRREHGRLINMVMQFERSGMVASQDELAEDVAEEVKKQASQ